MIDFEIILITCLPALTSILAIISAVASIFKAFKNLRKDIADKTENEELKAQLKAAIKECRQLKKVYQLAIEKEAKVHYKDLTEVQEDEDLQ